MRQKETISQDEINAFCQDRTVTLDGKPCRILQTSEGYARVVNTIRQEGEWSWTAVKYIFDKDKKFKI